jgi:hypothetical protein
VAIQWTLPEGNSVDDFILVYVDGCDDEDEFQSPLPWEHGGLNGHSTQFVIPAGTLNPGTIYNVDVEYFKVVDQHAEDGSHYPGVFGVAAFATNLSFNVQTTGESDGLCGASMHLVVGMSGQMLFKSGDTVTTNTHYPVSSHYSLSLYVRDPNPAAFQEVYFSGPAGSGINNVQAQWGGGEYPHYNSPTYDVPPLPLPGEYSVSYRGNTFHQFIDASMLEVNSVVVVPVFNLTDGVITSVELSYRHSQTGAVVDIGSAFDNAHITFDVHSGPSITRNFNPNSSIVELGDLNLYWDSVIQSIFINLNAERLTVYTGFQVHDEHNTWNGYPVQSDGRAYTGGLMGWVYVNQQPWIYSYSLDNWFFTYPDHMRTEGAWVWVVSNPDTLFGPFDFWYSWPHFGGSTWVGTGKFLGKIDTRHDPIIWSEVLNSWLFVPEEGFAAEGAWVFIYQMD